MFSAKKNLISLVILSVVIVVTLLFFKQPKSREVKNIAIANWGPHSSLEETIRGIQEGLVQAGYKEGEQVHFEISHVNFDPSLIGQMLAKLKASRPSLLVAMGTPVAQRAKGEIKDIPIVFTDITDPVAAGLIDEEGKAKGNVTGASDKQDLDSFMDFVLRLMPDAQRIGVLFATAEANDRALVKMMESAAAHHSMQVLAIPLDEPRDIPTRMQKFRNNVDLIYVGVSGPIQPSLPAIVSEADRMKIPVFNADAEQVRKHQAFAAFAVSYYQVGLNTAKVMVDILEGKKPEDIAPLYPKLEDHVGVISKKRAMDLGFSLPENLRNITVVE
jgi:putative ABC transport system substrate-binding protein